MKIPRAAKIGDVIAPMGAIVIGKTEALLVGAVVIRRSRLRRALRFGWYEVQTPDGRPIEEGCVMVERQRSRVPS